MAPACVSASSRARLQAHATKSAWLVCGVRAHNTASSSLVLTLERAAVGVASGLGGVTRHSACASGRCAGERVQRRRRRAESRCSKRRAAFSLGAMHTSASPRARSNAPESALRGAATPGAARRARRWPAGRSPRRCCKRRGASWWARLLLCALLDLQPMRVVYFLGVWSLRRGAVRRVEGRRQTRAQVLRARFRAGGSRKGRPRA